MGLIRIADGLGTSKVSFNAQIYALKSSDIINRYVRKETKTILENEFREWMDIGLLDRPKNNLLPTKLLTELLDDKIEWYDFAKKLYQHRIANDLKKGK
jgi:hypothetical protein